MSQPGSADRSIRSQLNRIVLIPSVTFLLLFAVISGATLTQAVSLHIAATDGKSGIRLYYAMVELQKERRLTAEYLAAPSEDGQRALRRQAGDTDTAARAVEDRGDALRGHGDPDVRDSAGAFFAALDGRVDLRKRVAAEAIDGPAAVERYRAIVDTGLHLYDVAGRRLDDGPSVVASGDALRLMRAQENFARADAVLSGAIAADRFRGDDRIRAAGLVSGLRDRLDDTIPELSGAPARAGTYLTGTTQWKRMNSIATAVASGDGPPSETAGEWRTAADTVSADLIVLTDQQVKAAITATSAAAMRMFAASAGGAALALLAGILAYVVAARSAGRLTSRLAALRADALALARDDLPRIVRRLGRGESVDVDREMKHLDYGDDEVGQVADAFNIAQHTAVAAAVKQSEIREGANRVFLGIAHRNQSLVQRQLQLLDRIEREEEDPDLLHELFQLDHLATRGRRNAENLIILGGSQPGRRWRSPIRLVDVLRGAISETEEYARVKLRVVPDIALHGAVVADVIHLVAELVENATAFSPPHTVVQIHCENVPKGVVIEIEDRGLGMTEEALAHANGTLTDVPEYDVMAMTEDARLGLFVVARLADKHGVLVELCPSPYGGVRAIVLLPLALIAPRPAEPAARPRPLRALNGGAGADRTTTSDPSGDLLASAGGAALTAGTAPGRGAAAPERPRDGSERAAPVNGATSLPQRMPKRHAETGAPQGPGTEPAPPPARTAAPAENAEKTDTADGTGRPGLPKRRRQASLAPQLRTDAGLDTGPRPVVDPREHPAPQRTPEEIRTTLSAFQRGTRRGREAEPDEPADPGGSAPATGGSADRRGTDDDPVGAPAGRVRGAASPAAGDHTEKSD